MNLFFYRNRLIRPIGQIFRFVLSLPLYFLGLFVPSKDNIWVFGNIYGFKDNAKYLFEFVHKYCPDIRPIWILNGHDCSTLSAEYERYQATSLKGLFFQYRAKVAFVATGRNDLASYTLGRTIIIQLWHGIPIKKILLDSPESLPFPHKWRILNRFAKYFLRKRLKGYSAVISSSNLVQNRLMSSFGLPAENVPIIGYPRHDIILNHSEIKKREILFAPTWRENIQAAISLFQSICNDEFLTALREKGYLLKVAIHPLNKEVENYILNLTNNIKILDQEDLNIELACSEYLITDFSSIAVDFCFLGREIIFYIPDYNNYCDDRGVNEEFEDLLKTNMVTKPSEIMLKINSNDTEIRYDRDKFFHFNDSGSRQRIVNFVKDKCGRN